MNTDTFSYSARVMYFHPEQQSMNLYFKPLDATSQMTPSTFQPDLPSSIATNSPASTNPSMAASGITTNKQDKPKRHRTSFTAEQLFELEQRYLRSQYLNHNERTCLAEKLGLTERHVKVWFQNRRMKSKKEKQRRKQDSLLEQLEDFLVFGKSSDQTIRKSSQNVTSDSISIESVVEATFRLYEEYGGEPIFKRKDDILSLLLEGNAEGEMSPTDSNGTELSTTFSPNTHEFHTDHDSGLSIFNCDYTLNVSETDFDLVGNLLNM